MLNHQHTGRKPLQDGSLSAMDTIIVADSRRSAGENRLHVTGQALASSFGRLTPTEAASNGAAFDTLHKSGQAAAISTIVAVLSELWERRCDLHLPDYLCLQPTSGGDSAGWLLPFGRACITVTADPRAVLEQMRAAAPADSPALQFWHVNGNSDLFAIVVTWNRSGALHAWIVDDDEWIPVAHARETVSRLMDEDCWRPGTESALRLDERARADALRDCWQEGATVMSRQRELFHVLLELAKRTAHSNDACPRLCG